MLSLKTVQDFALVFDSYAKFMERLTARQMDVVSKASPDEIEHCEFELELLISRFEHLLERRPLLLNSVLLRQNPHNVREWINRVHLYDGSLNLQLETFEEAARTIDPKNQTGSFADLWTTMTKLLEAANDLEKTRHIFERAILAPFAKVDELARVWCEYVEFQLRHG
jgi:pre-mRNA-splicing factor SYF1